MATTKSVAGLTTIVKNLTPTHFGGSSTKQRKRFVISATDATNGIAVGGTTDKLNVADLGVGMKTVDSCSNILVFTTSTGAPVRVYPAVPSTDGTYIVAFDPDQGTDANRANVADITCASTETLQLTVDGY